MLSTPLLSYSNQTVIVLNSSFCFYQPAVQHLTEGTLILYLFIQSSILSLLLILLSIAALLPLPFMLLPAHNCAPFSNANANGVVCGVCVDTTVLAASTNAHLLELDPYDTPLAEVPARFAQVQVQVQVQVQGVVGCRV